MGIDKIVKKVINAYQSPAMKKRALRLAQNFVFGTDCGKETDQTPDLLIGLTALAQIEQLQRQSYTPCQTAIDTFYTPELLAFDTVSFTLDCIDNQYKKVWHINDFIASGLSTIDYTSIKIDRQPSIGTSWTRSDGFISFVCPPQSMPKTAYIDVTAKSHYSSAIVFRITVNLSSCKTCFTANIVEVSTPCFTAQINELF
jgi:hypothetical protein